MGAYDPNIRVHLVPKGPKVTSFGYTFGVHKGVRV